MLRSLTRLSTLPPEDATALVTLAFLGAGYTHRSKETYDGVKFGDVVGERLMKLIDTPESDDEAAGLCALALCEAWRHTGSTKFKSHAEAAIADGLARRRADRGWGSIAATASWVLALRSARSGTLTIPDDVLDSVREHVAELRVPEPTADISGAVRRLGSESIGERDAAAAELRASGAAAQLAAVQSADPEVALRLRRVIEAIRADQGTTTSQLLCARLHLGLGAGGLEVPPIDGDAEFRHWAAMALYLTDGPDGEVWRSGSERLRVEPGDDSTAAETAHAALALEIYYRYPNALGTRP